MSDSRVHVAFDEVFADAKEIAKSILSAQAPSVDADARFPQESVDTLRSARLLSCYVPTELGGMGLSLANVCSLCELFGRYCASTAMIFAMHQIQVACIVHHARELPVFERFLKRLVDEQLLIASATTELGTGGDLASSICGLDVTGNQFRLVKQAPVISYGEYADFILVTCRADLEAANTDQVQVLVDRQETQLEPLSGWDTLGFRGTCSSGFTLTAKGTTDLILPGNFALCLSQTMQPVSHLVWGSLWYGLAAESLAIARKSVRKSNTNTTDGVAINLVRLAEADEISFSMRGLLHDAVQEYSCMVEEGMLERAQSFPFAIRSNNVKLRCSELVIEIVSKAVMIIGISAYRNDSSMSLTRQLRDAYGAMLMVNNDRIRSHNASMQLALR